MNDCILVAWLKHHFGDLSVAFNSDKDDFYQNLELAMMLTKMSDLVVFLYDVNAVSKRTRTLPSFLAVGFLMTLQIG